MSDKSATKGERWVPWGKVELIRATKAERWSWDVQGRGQRKFIYTLLEQGWAHRPAASYGVCLNMSEGGMRGVGWDGEWRGVARSKIIPHSPRSCKCSREVKPQIWHPKPWGEIYLVCELLQQDHKHKNGNDVNMCKHGLGSQTKPKLERFCQVNEMSSLVSELKKACSLWIAQAAVFLHF